MWTSCNSSYSCQAKSPRHNTWLSIRLDLIQWVYSGCHSVDYSQCQETLQVSDKQQQNIVIHFAESKLVYRTHENKVTEVVFTAGRKRKWGVKIYFALICAVGWIQNDQLLSCGPTKNKIGTSGVPADLMFDILKSMSRVTVATSVNTYWSRAINHELTKITIDGTLVTGREHQEQTDQIFHHDQGCFWLGSGQMSHTDQYRFCPVTFEPDTNRGFSAFQKHISDCLSQYEGPRVKRPRDADKIHRGPENVKLWPTVYDAQPTLKDLIAHAKKSVLLAGTSIQQSYAMISELIVDKIERNSEEGFWFRFLVYGLDLKDAYILEAVRIEFEGAHHQYKRNIADLKAKRELLVGKSIKPDYIDLRYHQKIVHYAAVLVDYEDPDARILRLTPYIFTQDTETCPVIQFQGQHPVAEKYIRDLMDVFNNNESNKYPWDTLD